MQPLRSVSDLNGHVIGIVMKELVRRAIGMIRKELGKFETYEKASLTEKKDWVTSADTHAQAMYLKLIKECFPTFGVIAEEVEEEGENHCLIPCTEANLDIYFTVDPLDGTKAFIRRQSHGIGTMISLVCNGEVIAACVGDIMTKEVYYCRPGSPHVHRIRSFDHGETLSIDQSLSLQDQYVLLRDAPYLYSKTVQAMIGPGQNPLVNGLSVEGGSIGICMARLWKGEVGMLVLKPSNETPWDLCPVAGISEKLGFIFVTINCSHTEYLVPAKPQISKYVEKRDHEVIVLHRSRYSELISWAMREQTE
ncbi:hypothetical protein A2841_02705 [Candidatus Kaiserbacteria bacterium RIFCSPHIGHO2_01_FULL_48_10]|uniref:3'(2'),5-bisphosphonucleoside 3'(2')-phosphohydrolase n=1 Tax=Candidatus Kaiserbacteria bacterium RIFCSPHIGHO2_01_FULL_48_10 TaxID=1798476 RepID=A0A1F6C1Y5_9BACT|nr:MAG: hypothetical protein A2841_02705 [Candidatus Kaiserbacteria bacterium RIFCSPHIGHO2_01_FULL_48_10]